MSSKNHGNKIGYLSPRGTFSHEAAAMVCDKDARIIGYPLFYRIIEAVKKQEIDEAVVPVENLVVGAIGKTMDALIKLSDKIRIKAELVLPVRQNLIACKDISLSSIITVLSIREATEQCGNWLKANIPNVHFEYTDSTASAVMDLHKCGGGAAAIGSIFATKMYGRKILAEDIHDEKDNVTHFLVISLSDAEYNGRQSKTSLIFSVPNKAGVLASVIGVFGAMDINMSKIESRPSKKNLGEYIFWVDIDGHREEDKIKKAIKAVERKTIFLRVLGSYPKFLTEEEI